MAATAAVTTKRKGCMAAWQAKLQDAPPGSPPLMLGTPLSSEKWAIYQVAHRQGWLVSIRQRGKKYQVWRLT